MTDAESTEEVLARLEVIALKYGFAAAWADDGVLLMMTPELLEKLLAKAKSAGVVTLAIPDAGDEAAEVERLPKARA